MLFVKQLRPGDPLIRVRFHILTHVPGIVYLSYQNQTNECIATIIYCYDPFVENQKPTGKRTNQRTNEKEK